eukprot:12430980-Karenia_brevis.AAC.1
MWTVSRRSKGGSTAILGIKCAKVTVRLVKLCVKHGVHWCLENPHTSRLLSWAPLRLLFDKYAKSWITFHACSYGAPFLKPTDIVSDMPELDDLQSFCRGGHRHEHLQGTVKVSRNGQLKAVWKSSLA